MCHLQGTSAFLPQTEGGEEVSMPFWRFFFYWLGSRDLETRYDNLLDVRLRAEARYKADYKTWRNIYRWLRSDGPDEDHPEVSEEIKKNLSKQLPTVARKRQLIVDGIVDISFMEKHIGGAHFAWPELFNFTE